MKKIILGALMILGLIIPITVKAKDKEITIYMFRGNTCPHCEQALTYLKNNLDIIPDNVKFVTYEVYKNNGNATLLEKVEKHFNFAEKDLGSIPLFVVGNEYILGYSTADDLKKVIELTKDIDDYEDIVAKEINSSNIKVKGLTIEQLIGGPSKTGTIIVFSIFGAIIIGFCLMFIFSKNK